MTVSKLVMLSWIHGRVKAIDDVTCFHGGAFLAVPR